MQRSHEYYFDNGDVLYRIHKNSAEIFDTKIPSHALTPSGKELYAFINSRKNEDYLGVLAEFLRKRSSGRLAYAQILDRIGPEYRIGPWTEVEPRIPSKQE